MPKASKDGFWSSRKSRKKQQEIDDLNTAMARISELEARIAKLEELCKGPTEPVCPYCDNPKFRVIESESSAIHVRSHPGLLRRRYKCFDPDCGRVEERLEFPDGSFPET
jgi:hypothetical protein